MKTTESRNGELRLYSGVAVQGIYHTRVRAYILFWRTSKIEDVSSITDAERERHSPSK